MRPGPDPIFLFIELGIALVALVFCLLIYFKTREAYSLTKHKGIKYFRDAFLLFGISYILRFLFSIVFLSRVVFEDGLARLFLTPLFILLLGYISTMSILYLIFSTVWKKIKGKHTVLLGHILAVLVSILAFITRGPWVLMIADTILAVIAIALIFTKKDNGHGKKKQLSTRVLYMLVLLAWIVNLFIAGSPFLPRGIDQIFQLFAAILFIIIYYKVNKWVR